MTERSLARVILAVAHRFRFLLRPWCTRHAHRNGGVRMWSLPEEVFGLYAYSRLECIRCGGTIAQHAPFTDEERAALLATVDD